MTPEEVREQKAAEENLWRTEIQKLAEQGEFYSDDLYEALLQAGMPLERKQQVYQKANYLFRKMEVEGELTSEIKLREGRPCRRYYRGSC